ncbi:MAG: hypothetical protein ACK4UY_04120 [Dietzia sp.]
MLDAEDATPAAASAAEPDTEANAVDADDEMSAIEFDIADEAAAPEVEAAPATSDRESAAAAPAVEADWVTSAIELAMADEAVAPDWAAAPPTSASESEAAALALAAAWGDIAHAVRHRRRRRVPGLRCGGTDFIERRRRLRCRIGHSIGGPLRGLPDAAHAGLCVGLHASEDLLEGGRDPVEGGVHLGDELGRDARGVRLELDPCASLCRRHDGTVNGAGDLLRRGL